MLHISHLRRGLPTIRMVAAAGWRYHRHGPPESVLRHEHYRVPFDRTSSHVVVKMLASPVHRHDRNFIVGLGASAEAMLYAGQTPPSFPRVAGVEGVGVVEEVGQRCGLALKEGDMVWVNNPTVGCWSTHLVTDADHLDVVPHRADVDIEYLASLSLFHTAYHLTHDFVHLQPNDVVLQTGASSSIAQICQGYLRAKGCKLFQTMQLGRTDHAHLAAFFKMRGAFAVVPYSYARTNYMRRLLSDVSPPRLMLNHTCGTFASSMISLLGNGGVCVTYGNTSHKPMQISNMDLIARGIKLCGFCLPHWIATHSRESRMRVHQHVIESITIAQGHGVFRAQRFAMQKDGVFAFSNAWDTPLCSRKSVLRMVGEYGEWRKPRGDQAGWNMGRTVWEDLIQQMWEASGSAENPQSMKYYTPFQDVYSTFHDAQESREMGHREVFFRRPNAPRHNASEQAH